MHYSMESNPSQRQGWIRVGRNLEIGLARALTNPGKRVKYRTQWVTLPPAEVAELADALRSGRSEITLVRVQIPPSALRIPNLASKLQPGKGIFVYQAVQKSLQGAAS